MLKSLALHDWKSFGTKQNHIALGPMTLLVGPNGSGKSNVVDALRFLQGTSFDYPLGDVLRGRWEGGREIWPAVRGQVAEAARAGRPVFGIVTKWTDNEGEDRSWYGIGADCGRDVTLAAEAFSDGTRMLFDTNPRDASGVFGVIAGGAALHVHVRDPAGELNPLALDGHRSILGQFIDQGEASPDALHVARSFQHRLREIVFLDIQPSRMRDYRPEHAASLGTSGENISPILAALDTRALNDIVDWVSELCAPGVAGIEFDRTRLKEVMFFLKEGETQISARSVSDGTLRFLGLVTALLTAPPGQFIVVEEPDVGLHPARIHLLARLLEQATDGTGVQVLATTHSPTLLAHLSESSLRNVVALGRGDDGCTVASRLGDLEHFDTLRTSEQFEHLVSTGWIERAL